MALDYLAVDLAMKIYDLVDRLVETESHGREIQSKLDISCTEISKANDTNRCLKSRLGAVYAELDKKNEGLDRMIAKCQILTEKVASQEEVSKHIFFKRPECSYRLYASRRE